MSKKKPIPINMGKKNKNHIGTIKGKDLVKHRSEGYNPTPFKTGKHMTEKDRPRKKYSVKNIEW